MSSVSSSSLVSSSFWSWASVVYVVCSCVSVLLMKSLSTASHFELFSAVASQIISTVRSLSSLLLLSDCEWVLRSSPHLLVGLPCLLRLFFNPTPLVSCLPTSECVSPVVFSCGQTFFLVNALAPQKNEGRAFRPNRF